MDGEKSVLNGTLTDLGLGQFTRRTNEIVKRINEQTLDYYEVVTALQLIIEDKHQNLLDLSKGSYKLLPIESIIDTDKTPSAIMDKDRKNQLLRVKRHNGLGKLSFHPDYIGLYLTKKQKEGGYVNNKEYLKELEKEKVLNANILFWIIENQKFISKTKRKSLRSQYSQIAFLGTIYENELGEEYILTLYFSDYINKFDFMAQLFDINFPLQLPAAVLI